MDTSRIERTNGGVRGLKHQLWQPFIAAALIASLCVVGGCSGVVSGNSSTGSGGGGGTQTATLQATPSSASFGNVNVGSSATQTVTISNSGTADATISAVTPTSAGITASGIAVSTVIKASQSATLTIQFAPTATGAVTGSVQIGVSQGTGVTVAVTGAGVQPGLNVTPSSATFSSVVIGTNASQTIQMQNTGSSSLTVSQANVTGAGFSTTGLSLPLTIAAGKTSSFNIVYTPTTAGNVTGSVSLVSNAPNSPTNIALSASAVAATRTLSITPSSVNFGSVNTGTSASQNVTIRNTGNTTVNVTQITAAGTGFTAPGSAVNLSASQSTTVPVQFAPATAGSFAGTLTITSNATGSPAVVNLSGTGVVAVQHSVVLNWGASTSTVAGYNVYRSTVSGGSYSRVNGSAVGGLTYTDSTVSSGRTYYYVTTAVDSSGNESVYSNEVPAVIP